MNILLVYPKFPPTFWSWRYLLWFVGKKAAFPPVGLLTVAALLPRQWGKKLVDLNVCKLKDNDIRWADYVLVSAMMPQSASAKEVIRRCDEFGVRVVLGGPILPEMGYVRYQDTKWLFPARESAGAISTRT
ncbi:MAG: hypothetical protein NTY61_03720 [Candidatus Parcubacteria bacterium]|nr:hypothetical protein [Candidatus Parcubacteria bacterium]